MDFHAQKADLSFSIENILREDFSHHRRPCNVDNLQPRDSSFESWPTTSPVFRCYALHYSPYVVMKYLPASTHRGTRLQRPNGFKPQFWPTEPEHAKEEEILNCKDKAIQKDEDDASDKEFLQESKTVTCRSENVPKKKRRNRSHFTQRQLQYLEKIFSRQQYLTRDERTLLARGLEMTELQIRNWFQNRRYQRRHRANEDAKLDEPDTAVAS